MSAGASALREARRAELRVAEYERRLLEEQARAGSFRVAARAEAQLAARLRAMDAWGWRLLEDRRWPGTRSANVDLILVGPGGVLVVDVKCWAEPDIVDGRLYRGQAAADDDVDKLRRQTELVTDTVAPTGLAPAEVVPVLAFMNQRGTDVRLGRVRVLDEHTLVPWAVRRGARLTEDQVDELVRVLDDAFPPHDGPLPVEPGSVVIPEPVLPAGRHEQPVEDVLFDAAALDAAVVEHALSAPIEDWMTFLHPDQVRLVRRVDSGPARIRGAAGTGKTVVALHRAAFLAESLPAPVLFTTFVRSLPPVLESLCRRLSPASGDRVEFTNLHAWALHFLAGRGHRVKVDTHVVTVALDRAWRRRGHRSCLENLDAGSAYWKDEIEHVIKGRGLTDYDDYANLRRVGRRTRLLPVHREAVWAVYREYEAQLRNAGVHDFTDVLTLALAELRERPLETPYGAVIADEVQDLNCQAVRLLKAIAGDAPLLLIGDGQQQIYPGGYSLAEAGVSVAGRSTVLRTNYRNGADIVAAASQVVADDEFDDLEETSEPGRREIATARAGGHVWRVQADTRESLRQRAVAHVRRLLDGEHEPGGVALLCGRYEIDDYIRLLTAAGVPAVALTKYTGAPIDAVKVGTVHRAKGLEFTHVVCPVHDARPRGRAADAIREERERANRQLFVAMTRARDSVWIGRVA